MTEPASARARMQSHDLRVRRSTTAAVSAAICLTGLLTGVASAAPVQGRGTPGLQPPTADQGSTALAKAQADYEAAVAAQHQTTTAPTRLRATARVAAVSRPAPAPVAVTGGS